MIQASKIDLNADIGEGMPYDKELINYISSCNIACGGHIGDDNSILETIGLAKENNMKIGAHPSYPDKLNFGRKSINISIEDLVKSVDIQLNNFKNKCNQLKAKWHHIKFHGALYNDLKSDKHKAEALVDLINEKYPNLILYVPPNSAIEKTAKGKISIQIEGFADRAYHDDLSLVPRSQPHAVLIETDEVIQQVKSMVLDKKVNTVDGGQKSIDIQTLCLHGDTPSAIELVKAIVKFLKKNNIQIQ